MNSCLGALHPGLKFRSEQEHSQFVTKLERAVSAGIVEEMRVGEEVRLGYPAKWFRDTATGVVIQVFSSGLPGQGHVGRSGRRDPA